MASGQERIAILFIHGILGTTSHFEPFLSLVPPNWSICNLSLKGHGGSVKDFSQASMTEWKQQRMLLKNYQKPTIKSLLSLIPWGHCLLYKKR
mgnify:CR=1 FL=1